MMRKKVNPSLIRPATVPLAAEKIANPDKLVAVQQNLLQISQRLSAHTGPDNDAAAICRDLKGVLRFFHRSKHLPRDLETGALSIVEEMETMLEMESVDPACLGDAVAALAKDVGIRLVEWHFRPSTLAQVRALAAELQQAGVAHLLYARYKRASKLLSGGENVRCRRTYERWIDFIWDHPSVVALLSEGSVDTTHDLMLWLRKNAPEAARGEKNKLPNSARA